MPKMLPRFILCPGNIQLGKDMARTYAAAAAAAPDALGRLKGSSDPAATAEKDKNNVFSEVRNNANDLGKHRVSREQTPM